MKTDPAKAFEAYFYRQILKETKIGEIAFGGGGVAGSTFSDMFTEALADQMASAGELSMSAALGGSLSPSASPGAGAPLSVQPVAGRISSSFGLREDPIDGLHRHHDGLDIAAPAGTPVRAAGGGVVVRATDDAGGYGRMVVVDHGDGLTTRYAHLSDMTVREGDRLEPGAVLGRVGSTGRSTGPHLHFEVRRGDHPVDPEKALPPLKRR